jgi:Domain of unknown function (DUF1648)
MNRVYTLATCVMWLALPITALGYWRVWDRLPMRMAVHFDANWQPNGYTSREGALYLGLGIMASMLVLFTISALIVRAMKPSASWPVLVVAYVTLGFCFFGNHAIVNFNLNLRSSQLSVPRRLCQGGLVLRTGNRERKGARSLSLSSLHGQGGDFEFRVNIHTLSERTRQGWGTLD